MGTLEHMLFLNHLAAEQGWPSKEWQIEFALDLSDVAMAHMHIGVTPEINEMFAPINEKWRKRLHSLVYRPVS